MQRLFAVAALAFSVAVGDDTPVVKTVAGAADSGGGAAQDIGAHRLLSTVVFSLVPRHGGYEIDAGIARHALARWVLRCGRHEQIAQWHSVRLSLGAAAGKVGRT